MRGLARPSTDMLRLDLRPRVWVWGFWFGLALRSLVSWRVCAIALSFMSGWQAFSSVSLCQTILYSCCEFCAGVASVPSGARARARVV
jgi:hypothetical protein